MFEDFYLETYTEIDHARRDQLTDIIIPFYMASQEHFALMHVKLVGDRKQPVISWLCSLGTPMPEAVRKRVDKVFQQPDKVVHECPIRNQQTNGYDCGVYVAYNADVMVQNKIHAFKTLTAQESVALRKEIVRIGNEDSVQKYVFVDNPKASEAEGEDWTKDQFINTVSQDLLQFGEMVQDKDNAFDEFDHAFDIAAAAYQNAEVKSLANNRFAFFSEYQGLKAQLAQYQTAKSPAKTSCAAEVEPILEEGKDFKRVEVN